MKFSDGKDITCKFCNSRDVTIRHTPKGIGYCTCNSCNNKFVIECDENHFIDSYLSERGKIFSELETAKLNNKNSTSVKHSLENLVRNYSVFADIDPIYFWYKIEIITNGFKDFSKYEEAEKEYLNINKSNCFFVDGEDVGRNATYSEKYEKYKQDCLAQAQSKKVKSKRKKKFIIWVASVLVCAMIIGFGLFAGFYSPVVEDEGTGINIKVDNSSSGLFGKFFVKPEISECEDQEVETALSTLSNKFVAYDISLKKSGSAVTLKDEVEITIPVPKTFYRGKLGVYQFDGQDLKEVEYSVAKGNKVSISTKDLGIFAIAELPFKVEFDGNGADYGKTEAVFFGEKVSRPAAPERAGYTFGGWYLDGGEFNFSYPVDKDMKIIAQWTANTYKVTYRVNGQEAESRDVTFGDEVKLYSYEKTGYTIHWYNGENEVTDGVWSIADDVVLDAVEVANTYEVSLVTSVTECCPAVSGNSAVNATYDSALPAITVPNKTGYVFEGYYTEEDGKGVKCYGADGTGTDIWQYTDVSALYANWVLDTNYSGYKYISTYNDLKNIASSGKYLLVNDIDMNGNSWTPITSFSGTFDGGHHRIYNFKITSGYHSGDLIYNFGLFAVMSGTVKNLQIGKEDTTTSINHSQDDKRYNAGMIAAYCSGKIYNCRVIACSIYLKTFAQSENFKDWEFSANVGGAVGKLTSGASLQKCQIEGTSITSRVEVRYNLISAMARAGGAVGFSVSATIADCIVKGCTITSFGKSHDGFEPAIGKYSWSGKPNARSGCIVGTMIKEGSNSAVLTRCVEMTNSIRATKEAGKHTDDVNNNTGTSYSGAMVGESSSNTSSNLIGVNSGLSCSGTQSNYSGFTRITQDSYNILIETASAFKNGYWISDNGKISVDFYNN